MSTVVANTHRRRRWVNADLASIGSHSADVRSRQDLLRRRAARVITALFPPHSAIPEGITAKKLSAARATGGGLGDVFAVMAADPAARDRIPAEISCVAAELREAGALCLHRALREAKEADVADELPAHDVLVEMTSDALILLRNRYGESIAKLTLACAAIDRALYREQRA